MRRIIVRTETLFSRVPGGVEKGAELVLSPGESHHVRDVLRLESGKVVEITDGEGSFHEAVITRIGPRTVTVTLTGRRRDPPPPAPVTLAVALTKKGLDDVVRKSVEIGIERVVPLRTERTLAKLRTKKERWERIAAEAGKQAARGYRLDIEELVEFPSYLRRPACGVRFVADPDAASPLFEEVRRLSPPYEIAVGPEGGFSREETERLSEAGFRPVSLGDGILRTETAAVAAAVILAEAARLTVRDEADSPSGR